ncbi:MAG TPA: hypothetical protein PLD10_08800, partial [Rhodopila sp.]|nr:hypothetical protein [Rhodopila sp.]
MSATTYSYSLINPPFSFSGTYRSVSVTALNNQGVALGSAYNSTGSSSTSTPFLYDNGSYTTLSVPWANTTTVTQLNNAGQVIGRYQDSAGTHSFIYQNGHYTDVAVPGAAMTTLLQSSSSGKLLGTYFNSSGLHPFIDDNGHYIPLSVPGATSTFVSSGSITASAGPGINDSDQVIGRYTDSSGSHAFL